jgi:hypothetical protein
MNARNDENSTEDADDANENEGRRRDRRVTTRRYDNRCRRAALLRVLPLTQLSAFGSSRPETPIDNETGCKQLDIARLCSTTTTTANIAIGQSQQQRA